MKKPPFYDILMDSVSVASIMVSFLIFHYATPITIKLICCIIDAIDTSRLCKTVLFLLLPLVLLFIVIILNFILFKLGYVALFKLIVAYKTARRKPSQKG